MTRAVTKFFDKKPVTTITYHDRPAWLATEVSTALGYADNTQISRNVNTAKAWRGEFEEGVEYMTVEGQELRDIKEILKQTSNSDVCSNARKIMLLFESGLYLATSKCELPSGARFRRWISRDVVPEIMATGMYVSPERSLALSRDKMSLARDFIDMKKELGLWDERSRLLAADIIDNAAIEQSSRRQLPSGDRMVTVAQLAGEMRLKFKAGKLSIVGTRVARIYRQMHGGRQPNTIEQKIGRRPTPVNDYHESEMGDIIRAELLAEKAREQVDTGQTAMNLNGA